MKMEKRAATSSGKEYCDRGAFARALCPYKPDWKDYCNPS